MSMFDNVQNVKELLEYVGEQLDIQHLDEWYNVTCMFHSIPFHQFIDFCKTDYTVSEKVPGVVRVMNYHRGSFIHLLLMVYPNHNWELWRFRKTPVGAFAAISIGL